PSDRLRQAQEDVEEIKVIMLDNMNKADERAGKLGDSNSEKTPLVPSRIFLSLSLSLSFSLSLSLKIIILMIVLISFQSEKFSKTSIKVKQKKRWENIKYKVIMAAVVAAVVLGIILVVVFIYG
uniref:V-SNARE coiled-coil homology domain-containing protein n=1 Tax=Sinocyclocheilus rhinocerous TaxID=307959 RepID=A0A673LGD7_9TELE